MKFLDPIGVLLNWRYSDLNFCITVNKDIYINWIYLGYHWKTDDVEKRTTDGSEHYRSVLILTENTGENVHESYEESFNCRKLKPEHICTKVGGVTCWMKTKTLIFLTPGTP